ncbi:MAG: hypothetical protein MJZ81_10825 [Bacteroidales bacterium]|nr:hypothetical protein [Bacteroidales bacterium]
MIKCKFYQFSEEHGMMICTDPCPLYDNVCRYNQYWQTAEGNAELEEFFVRGGKDAADSECEEVE